MDVEAAYRRLGSPGRYHVFLYILLCFNYIPVVINHLVMALYGAKTVYTCAAAGSTSASALSSMAAEEVEVVWNGTVLHSSRSNNTVMDYMDVCLRSGNQSMSGGRNCSDLDYTVEEGERNIIMEFELVCGDAYLVNLATTLYFAGVMLGGLLFGGLSDRFGRKPFMLVTLYGHIIVGTALAFSNGYWMFVVLRFLMGILMQGALLVELLISGLQISMIIAQSVVAAAVCVLRRNEVNRGTVYKPGLQTCSYVMIMELFGPEYRTAVGTLFEVFWAGGIMWLALVGWALRDWRNIQLALTLPSIITIVYIWLVPESCRWLVAHKRYSDAHAILTRAAKFNGLQQFETEEDTKEEEAEEEEEEEKIAHHYTLCDMFKTPSLCRRSFVLFYVWMVIALAYYGLSLSVTSLAGNKYLNLFISGAIELPAYCAAVFILNRFGRRRPLVVYLVIGGSFCVAAGVVPKNIGGHDVWWLPTLLALSGKFGMAGCFGVILLYTCELYPTVIRNVSMGACAFWGRVGGMLAPQIMLLGGMTSAPVPVIIFGVMALSGGALTLLLPETLHTKLPDTLLQAEHLYTLPPPPTSHNSPSHSETLLQPVSANGEKNHVQPVHV